MGDVARGVGGQIQDIQRRDQGSDLVIVHSWREGTPRLFPISTPYRIGSLLLELDRLDLPVAWQRRNDCTVIEHFGRGRVGALRVLTPTANGINVQENIVMMEGQIAWGTVWTLQLPGLIAETEGDVVGVVGDDDRGVDRLIYRSQMVVLERLVQGAWVDIPVPDLQGLGRPSSFVDYCDWHLTTIGSDLYVSDDASLPFGESSLGWSVANLNDVPPVARWVKLVVGGLLVYGLVETDGGAYRVLVSWDGGLAWRTLGPDLTTTTMIDMDVAGSWIVVVGSAGEIHFSGDGGVSWDTVIFEGGVDLWGVGVDVWDWRSIDRVKIVVVDGNGAIWGGYWSNDFRQPWQRLFLDCAGGGVDRRACVSLDNDGYFIRVGAYFEDTGLVLLEWWGDKWRMEEIGKDVPVEVRSGEWVEPLLPPLCGLGLVEVRTATDLGCLVSLGDTVFLRTTMGEIAGTLVVISMDGPDFVWQVEIDPAFDCGEIDGGIACAGPGGFVRCGLTYYRENPVMVWGRTN